MSPESAKSSTDNMVELDAVFKPPARDRWLEQATAGLKEGCTLDSIQSHTLDGISIRALYDASPAVTTGATTHKTQHWDNRVCIESDHTASCKTQLMAALAGGANSIELHTNAAASVSELLADVQLAIAAVSLRAGSNFRSHAEELLAVAKAQGLSSSAIKASFNVDPIGQALQQGGLDKELAMVLQEMSTFAEITAINHPGCKSVLVDAAIHHNAGATPVDELHAAIATATLYVETMLDAGQSLDTAENTLVFQLAMDADTLIGVAKIRALRALWNHVLHTLSDSGKHHMPASIVAETSQRYLSLQQPWNNHLRNLAASTAACMAGTDAIVVHPHDRLNPDPDNELGHRMARNIPIILERECGMRKVSDPLGGSYAIENLTNELVNRTWQSLAAMDTSAQWLQSLQRGEWQQRLAHSHESRLNLLQEKAMIMVGVNQYVHTDDADNESLTSANNRPTECNNASGWTIQPLPRVRDAQGLGNLTDAKGTQP